MKLNSEMVDAMSMNSLSTLCALKNDSETETSDILITSEAEWFCAESCSDRVLHAACCMRVDSRQQLHRAPRSHEDSELRLGF